MTGDLEGAMRIWDAMVDACPDFAEAWHKRAATLFAMGKTEDSLKDSATVLRLEPRHFGAWMDQGVRQVRLERYADAVKSFRKLVEMHPTSRSAQLSLQSAEYLSRMAPEELQERKKQQEQRRARIQEQWDKIVADEAAGR